MTELKVKITRNLVKRATAIAMAICLVVTMMPLNALAKTRGDYDKSLDYYNAGYYDPSSGKGGYYDPANEEGYWGPTSIEVTPSTSLNMFVDQVTKLEAKVSPVESTVKVKWESTNETVAKVNQNGEVTGVGAGTTIIIAKAGKVEAKVNVTVKPIVHAVTSITLDRTVLTFDQIGATATLTATVGPEQATDKTVTWSTSDAKVATVKAGKVTAVGNGTATITAQAGDKKATATVTVKEIVAVSSVTLDKTVLTFDQIGATAILTATVGPEQATDKTVTWSTSDAKVATVEAGKVTAVGDGTATITAQAGDKKATATVTVKEIVAVSSVTLDKSTLTFDQIGATAILTATVGPEQATDKTVTWSTSDAKVATVEEGKVTAIGNGTATITAKAGDNTATATVTVSQKSSKVSITLDGQTIKGTLEAKVKKSYNLKAVVTPDNVDAKNAVVKWKSSSNKIATVNSKGKVTIKKTGTVTITATTADGKKATVKFKAVKHVVKVTKLTIKGSKTMKVNGTQTLKVTVNPATVDNKKVTWKSSNTKIATVDSKGKVKAKKKGTVKITVTAKDGSKKKATITIKVK